MLCTQLHSSGKNANSKCEAPVLVLFLLHIKFPSSQWPSYMALCLLTNSWTCNWRQWIFCWLHYFYGVRSTSPTFTIILKGDRSTLWTPVEQLATLKGSTIHSLAFNQVLTRDMIMKLKIQTTVVFLSIVLCIPSLYCHHHNKVVI